MQSPSTECSFSKEEEAADKALDLVDDYLSEKGLPQPISMLGRGGVDTENYLYTMDVIESLSRALEGHPPSYLLDLAAAHFPDYNFQYSPDPKDPVQVIAMTGNGPKTLYQVAKEKFRAEAQKHSLPNEFVDTLEGLIPDCSGQPHILHVFQELLKDRGSCFLGYYGFISRVALLFRDEPAFLRKLNTHLGRYSFRVTIVERLDGPSPVLVFPCSWAIEYVSGEGCQDLFDRVEYYRHLWLQGHL